MDNEAIKIVSENGWPVDRIRILIAASYYVEDEEAIKEDGIKVVFDEPKRIH